MTNTHVWKEPFVPSVIAGFCAWKDRHEITMEVQMEMTLWQTWRYPLTPDLPDSGTVEFGPNWTGLKTELKIISAGLRGGRHLTSCYPSTLPNMPVLSD